MNNARTMSSSLWMAEFGRHLAESLSRVPPHEVELVATGSTLSIMERVGEVPLRVASTYDLPSADAADVFDAADAVEILRDVQDEIAIYLGRAWPTNAQGVPLHPRAADDAGTLTMSFVPRAAGDGDALVLAPFVPPHPVNEARSAG